MPALVQNSGVEVKRSTSSPLKHARINRRRYYPNMVNRLLKIWNSVGYGDASGRALSGPIYPPHQSNYANFFYSTPRSQEKRIHFLRQNLLEICPPILTGVCRGSSRRLLPCILNTILTHPGPRQYLGKNPESWYCGGVVLYPRPLRCRKAERYQLLLGILYFRTMALLA